MDNLTRTNIQTPYGNAVSGRSSNIELDRFPERRVRIRRETNSGHVGAAHPKRVPPKELMHALPISEEKNPIKRVAKRIATRAQGFVAKHRSSIRRGAGRAAGTALGFIVGDIPGAVAGYKIGGKVADVTGAKGSTRSKLAALTKLALVKG